MDWAGTEINSYIKLAAVDNDGTLSTPGENRFHQSMDKLSSEQKDMKQLFKMIDLDQKQ